MNRTDFLRMMETDAPIDRQMIGEINDLINIFPYFQSAHMLLLKALQNSSDVRFESQLKNSAIHVADREVLYYFLKSNSVSVDDVTEHLEETVTTVNLVGESQQAFVTEKMEEPVHTVVAVGESQQAIVTEKIEEPVIPVISVGDSQQTVIENGKSSEDLINELEKTLIERDAEEESRVDEKFFTHSILIATESENEEAESTIFLINDETPPVEEKIFYMDPGFSFPDRSDLLELDLEEKASVEREEEIKYQIQKEYEEKNTRKQLQDDLIDKFIIANPRIEPQKEKCDQPLEDISKPYVEEKGGFVTDTLARIYINQGYYSKAIDIYEKLSLKFPEKSSYFAVQIEKVRELIKK